MISMINPNQWLLGILLLVVGLLAACKQTVDPGNRTRKAALSDLTQRIRVSSVDANAAEPAIATSPDGSVYVVWVEHGPKGAADVMIARFMSDGRRKDSPVRVNPQPGMATAWRGDPPTIAVSPDRTVLVGWTARAESKSNHATVMYLSASRDGGRTFDNPVRVNDDIQPGAHGMHSLAISNDGRIYMAWLDERNVARVRTQDRHKKGNAAEHHMEVNRELFFSFSTDGGKTFSNNQSVSTNVCPCCKTSMTVGVDGRIYLAWRQVLPGDFRHIAVSSSTDGGKSFGSSVIVSDDQWELKGCPVSGAALSAGSDGRLRVLWYAGAENAQQGIYWSESQDAGKTFRPRMLLATGFAHGTPVLLADKQNPPMAIWEFSADGKTVVRASSFPSSQEPVDNLVIAEGEVPAAVVQNDHVFAVYVAKEGENQGVWLATMRNMKRS